MTKQIENSTFKFHPSAPAQPIEDLTPELPVNSSQLLPTEQLNCDVVYDYAYTGLSHRAIAAALGVGPNQISFHFKKTIAAARAAKATELLLKLHDVVSGEKIHSTQLRAMAILLERADPLDKEPTVVIQQQEPKIDFVVPLNELNDA